MNQTKIDILLTLTELLYYYTDNVSDILLTVTASRITNKELLKKLRLLLKANKNYPSKTYLYKKEGIHKT